MTDRLSAYRAKMAEAGIEAALLSFPENVRYLTNFTGEGSVLVFADEAILCTDFRYEEQAARQSPSCRCALINNQIKLPALIAREVMAHVPKALAVELGVLTVRDYRDLEAALPRVPLNALPDIAETLRMVKDDAEQDAIKRASVVACEAFAALLPFIKPGVSEKDIEIELNYRMLRLGAEAVAFQTIAGTGRNGALPHATPSADRVKLGDFLVLDFGAQVDGYKTDMTRTVAIGEPSRALKDVYQTVLGAQRAALDAIRPGMIGRDVDKIARDLIEPRYPGRFGHSLGHGVGLCIHEAPNFSVRCGTAIAPGNVMTVEPGIYLEGVGGCRIEDTVIVTEDGYTDLITAPKDLIIL